MGILQLNAQDKGLVSMNEVTNALKVVVTPDGEVNVNALPEDVLQQAERTLTSAEVLALFTTPIEVVAAPGAGKYIELVSAVLAYDYGTTAYTIGSATNLAFKYTNGAGTTVSGTAAVTGFLDQTADEARVVPAVTASFEPTANAALMLTLAGANVTLGNGTVKVKVLYRIHTI